jgi:hypothetical protein
MVKLYHKKLGLPKNLARYTNQRYSLEYTRHAQMECVKDKYKLIYPPFTLVLILDDIIEIEEDGGKVTKIVARTKYDDSFDLIVVFIPNGNKGVVKTVWLNEINDNHKTLDKSKYSPFEDSQKYHEGFI